MWVRNFNLCFAYWQGEESFAYCTQYEGIFQIGKYVILPAYLLLSITYVENFYSEKLKNEGSPRWASKKQKG